MGDTLAGHAWQTFLGGGPVMIALAFLSLLLYKNILGLLVFVRRIRLDDLDDDLDALSDEDDWELVLARYEEAIWKFRSFIGSRLRYTHALLVAAPLLGLLGTVIGMLETFRGLSLQAGYETMQLVADGVSRALITTETGLVIAIPALFFTYTIRRVSRRRELELLERKVLAVVN